MTFYDIPIKWDFLAYGFILNFWINECVFWVIVEYFYFQLLEEGGTLGHCIMTNFVRIYHYMGYIGAVLNLSEEQIGTFIVLNIYKEFNADVCSVIFNNINWK